MFARRVLQVLFASFLALLAACAHTPPEIAPAAGSGTPPLILISIDGFRADYLDRGITPNLKALAETGASAAMRPSFPSLTFPNHYALVTGKRPDDNGIVNNTMRDPARPGAVFKLSDAMQVADRFWWDEAVPFWVSAEQAGIKTGTMFWPGSEAAIHGVRPSRWLPFDKSLSSLQRVDQILRWFDLPAAERPQAFTLYFDEVDTAGHHYGPDSAEVNAAATHVDTAIGRLRAGLSVRGLAARTNLIIVADHGMAAVAENRGIFLDELLPRQQYELITAGTVLGVNPKPGFESAVDAALITPHPHMQCWHKANIPERLHYGKNPRVAEIICAAEVGWVIGTDRARGIGYKGGAHGYDPASPEMQALFIANGPAIKPGIKLPSFDNVAVYDLEMGLLHLQPEPNDGSLAPLAAALK